LFFQSTLTRTALFRNLQLIPLVLVAIDPE